jgi:polysaccharide pyruvyl transferase WcaK-like protein
MKVLIDHGAWFNFGDFAMLESVVGRYLSYGNLECHVVHREGLPTSVWDQPGVIRAAEPVVDTPLGRASRWRIQWTWRLRLLDLFLSGRPALEGRRRIEHRAMQLAEYSAPYDFLHVGGGAYLNDYFAQLVFDKCCLIHAFKNQGKPVLISGQQIGPLRRRTVRGAVGRALRRADFVGVRDEGDSMALCREMGLRPGQYELVSDDSFGLVPPSIENLKPVMDQYGLEPGRFIAANARISTAAPENAAHVPRLAELFRGLARRMNMPVLIVPIALQAGSDDLSLGRRLEELAGDSRVRLLQPARLGAATVKGILGQAKVGVGISHHFSMFLLSSGVPVIVLYDGAFYTQKARAMREVWREDRVAYPLAGMDAGKAIDHILSFSDDPQARERIQKRAAELAVQWESTFDRIVSRASMQRGGAPVAARHALAAEASAS